MSNFKDFDEYITSLKAESERGAVPNNEVPLEKFIQVARNILKKIEDLNPSSDTPKELYDLSQKYMLENRFVFLFTRVIWAHPDASESMDVIHFRKKAILLLNEMPTLRTRMRACWQRGQWTTGGSVVPDKKKACDDIMYPHLDDVWSDPRLKATPASYPILSSYQQPERIPSISASISVPFNLPATFQDIAKDNTQRGIETCGILLGQRIARPTLDTYKVTTMMIPKQSGTRDTCETLPGAEERILTYALTNNLVCLGWIHTHPTQSCFLSSIDMHTTLPYQQMLESAIAIVVAPTDSKLPIGVWRLTPYGMSKLRGCKLSGFHDHQGKEAYSELVNDISWDTAVNVVVVDLRR